MLELGDAAVVAHREVGRMAARNGVDLVVAVGGDMARSPRGPIGVSMLWWRLATRERLLARGASQPMSHRHTTSSNPLATARLRPSPDICVGARQGARRPLHHTETGAGAASATACQQATGASSDSSCSTAFQTTLMSFF